MFSLRARAVQQRLRELIGDAEIEADDVVRFDLDDPTEVDEVADEDSGVASPAFR
ncbi:MAG: hypothetical protein JXB36_00935 [Gammaproteobacteria bacterium]|nr:hypothetical protein [Gammaproteobacteria bacterium]